ncbi:hypothetical protein PVK06_019567 [Gossypium arboreum]|uniref:Uncharacterized protein n=1 Tax=Gossypium arboreum TaxID=29729 RepID=A0ABR0PK21_GOSAR|nr:hypothetical protein PVK06_019567 [Gossypium arboreum]
MLGVPSSPTSFDQVPGCDHITYSGSPYLDMFDAPSTTTVLGEKKVTIKDCVPPNRHAYHDQSQRLPNGKTAKQIAFEGIAIIQGRNEEYAISSAAHTFVVV